MGDAIGNLKVLVLAHPDLAFSICRAIEDCLGVEAFAPDVNGDRTEGGDTVTWLCSHTLSSSSRPSVLKRIRSGYESLSGRLKAHLTLALGGRLQSAGHANENRADSSIGLTPVPKKGGVFNLFKWGYYDLVLIQDLWLTDASNSDARSLEFAGFILAYLDYYQRGNFSTKKIILVTDKEFLLWRDRRSPATNTNPSSAPSDFEAAMRRAFDERGAFDWIDLVHKDVKLNERLEAIINSVNNFDIGEIQSDRTGEQASASKARSDTTVPSKCEPNEGEVNRNEVETLLYAPVMHQVKEHLRDYIREHAEVIMVDDEIDQLQNIFESITGDKLEIGAKGPGSAPKVHIALASQRSSTLYAEKFEELVEQCMKIFRESGNKEDRYVLFITDILFKLPTWNKTGIDLIKALRQKLERPHLGSKNNERRFGIVAFTGFTTPFITMSSYQLGADFVVPKDTSAPKRKHEIVTTSGTDYLLMTLAFLCFQKSLLRINRRRAQEIINDSSRREEADEALRELRRVLPRHTVSLYIQQEWLDTGYLFEAIKIYGAGNKQLGEICQKVTRKYDG